MDVEPAGIDQIRSAADGRLAMISADAGNVAKDLARIDPCLKVRFAENGRPPFFAVYYESPDGKQTYLVLTVKAHQTNTGIWEGLDQRVVRRIQEIDPHGRSGYDYARELEAQEHRRKEAHRQKFRERIAETGEQAVHALRKDAGSKSSAFIK